MSQRWELKKSWGWFSGPTSPCPHLDPWPAQEMIIQSCMHSLGLLTARETMCSDHTRSHHFTTSEAHNHALLCVALDCDS